MALSYGGRSAEPIGGLRDGPIFDPLSEPFRTSAPPAKGVSSHFAVRSCPQVARIPVIPAKPQRRGVQDHG